MKPYLTLILSMLLTFDTVFAEWCDPQHREECTTANPTICQQRRGNIKKIHTITVKIGPSDTHYDYEHEEKDDQCSANCHEGSQPCGNCVHICSGDKVEWLSSDGDHNYSFQDNPFTNLPNQFGARRYLKTEPGKVKSGLGQLNFKYDASVNPKPKEDPQIIVDDASGDQRGGPLKRFWRPLIRMFSFGLVGR